MNKICDHFLFIFPKTNVSLTKYTRYHQAAASILKSGILHFRKEKCARGTRPTNQCQSDKMPRYHQAAARILKSGILHFRKEKWTKGTWSWALWRTKVAMFAAADESAQKLKQQKRAKPRKFMNVPPAKAHERTGPPSARSTAAAHRGAFTAASRGAS